MRIYNSMLLDDLPFYIYMQIHIVLSSGIFHEWIYRDWRKSG
jgi:hypothetical protein